jgi:hypothetical protein
MIFPFGGRAVHVEPDPFSNVRGESSDCPQGKPYSRHLLDAGHGVYRFVEDKRTSALAGSMSKQNPENPLLDVGINLTRGDKPDAQSRNRATKRRPSLGCETTTGTASEPAGLNGKDRSAQLCVEALSAE